MAGYAAHLSLVRLVRLAVLGLALSAPGARASETWRPDTSFATGGSLTLTLGGAVATSRAAPLPDGGVVIAVSEGGAGHLVQLRADGSRDPAFGADGVAAQLAPVSEMMARAPDGRIYVGGYSGDPRVYTVRRYTPAGSPDAGFGTNGALAVTVTDDPADIALPTHVLVDAHARILVVGVAGHRFGAVTRRVVTVAGVCP
jgi:hypothetical protein